MSAGGTAERGDTEAATECVGGNMESKLLVTRGRACGARVPSEPVEAYDEDKDDEDKDSDDAEAGVVASLARLTSVLPPPAEEESSGERDGDGGCEISIAYEGDPPGDGAVMWCNVGGVPEQNCMN